MLTAVLEARCGVPLSGRDIFLNVAGGLKISETAADLAVAAALISSVTGRPAPQRTVFFGEVALSAELRQVAQSDARLKEAAKLGFDKTTPEGHEYRITISYCKTCGSQKATSNIKHVK